MCYVSMGDECERGEYLTTFWNQHYRLYSKKHLPKLGLLINHKKIIPHPQQS